MRRPTNTVTYLACKPETVKLVDARKAARAAKDAATQGLEETNAALARLLTHAETGFTPAELASIHGYRDRIVALNATIAETTAALAKADAALSLKLELRDGVRATDEIERDGLPIDNIIAKKVSLAASDARLNAFIDRHFASGTGEVADGIGPLFMARACTKEPQATCGSVQAARLAATALSVARLEAQQIALRVDGDTPSLAEPPKGQRKRSGPLHASRGIIYVEPARYTFSLKQDAFPANPLEPVTTLKAVTASVPQKGTYLLLPVHAGFGEKVELKAAFNTDGSLATASFGRPSSAGKAISASLAGLTDKALSTQDAIAARKLALLKAEAERLTAQKAIVDARDKLDPKDDPLADLNAQIAMANANATLAEANVRLMVANAKLSGGQ